MKAVVCGIIVIIVAGIAGCGGGGGGQTSLLTPLPAGIVGTYQVKGLNILGDQLAVTSNGDVIVNSEKAATKGSSQAKIGSCTAQGDLALNGSWTAGGTDYKINGSGKILPQKKSVTLEATVTHGDVVTQHPVKIDGGKVNDDMLPPPPPPSYDSGGDDDDMLKPPPPPDDSGNDDGMLNPPPPPY